MGADGLYEGTSKDVVLILAGIHESEQSGVEVACWVKVLLDDLVKQGRKPTKTIMVVRDVDQARGAAARLMYLGLSDKGPPTQHEVIKSKFREVMEPKIVAQVKPPSIDSDEGMKHTLVKPNRMFPAPGFPRRWLGIEPGKALDDYIKILEGQKIAFAFAITGATFMDAVISRLPLISFVYKPGGTTVKLAHIDQRTYPPPAIPADLTLRKDRIREWLPIRDLMDMIEEHKPKRIVSCHGIIRKGSYVRDAPNSFAGIFVDPRYSISGVELEQYIKGKLKLPARDKEGKEISPETLTTVETLDRLKFTSDRPGSAFSLDGKKDDLLALTAAQHVFNNKENAAKKTKGVENPVAGNWLDPGVKEGPAVHYKFAPGTSNPAGEKKSTKKRDPFRATGFSLGDWGPASVSRSGLLSDEKEVRGIRDGAPVFTVEPPNYHPSGVFSFDLFQLVDRDGKLTTEGVNRKWDITRTNLDRAAELRTFAEAIIEVICETPL